MKPDFQSFMLPTGGNFTGLKIGHEDMAFENTVATGLLDESGSTNSFARDMEKAVGEIIKSLRDSPRAENLMYRHCHFGTGFREHHGYTPLSKLNPADYDGCYQPGGATHLYDGSVQVIEATQVYGEEMMKKKYLCNGFIYIITDGADYGSTLTIPDVRDALAKAVASEALESLMTILIGVNVGSYKDKLEQFKNEAGLTQFITLENTSAKALAKLAGFIASSMMSQSQHLGSGGPSQPLDPNTGKPVAPGTTGSLTF